MDKKSSAASSFSDQQSLEDKVDLLINEVATVSGSIGVMLSTIEAKIVTDIAAVKLIQETILDEIKKLEPPEPSL